MDASFSLQNSHGIMDEEEHLSSSSSDFSSDSIASDLTEDASSSSSSFSGPLYEMSSLLEQLPIKRGLSKHFQGKSQSFTSLSNVRCLEDLAKQESPYRKKLKSCKSYGGGLDSHRSSSYTPTKTITKKVSRISKRNSLFGNKPPIPSQMTSSFSNQTPFVCLRNTC